MTESVYFFSIPFKGEWDIRMFLRDDLVTRFARCTMLLPRKGQSEAYLVMESDDRAQTMRERVSQLLPGSEEITRQQFQEAGYQVPYNYDTVEPAVELRSYLFN
ncbi:MAG: hypothetical protein ABS85_06390 [Sphingobacteriales bacterium SCN 48-20]|jgi:hypothetical protein|uniref:hypothetical protein n=1 Tax=Terrimonas ferruginea TaxID=249 RepID=UPI000868D6DE|nr:hypothetical protein [Terrimonas ferruginea]MBN8781696.1 hypothetical protein [Terrimonas ferruginea]ODT93230.1 MAG: hypothetical protein ABS85_06390 [Sphingobacteriales bacterium SCN 48-20]OJW44850.1 MAG: hypothetical protein BGO56_15460 [Sphingobacteriales bacterium 48-107]